MQELHSGTGAVPAIAGTGDNRGRGPAATAPADFRDGITLAANEASFGEIAHETIEPLRGQLSPARPNSRTRCTARPTSGSSLFSRPCCR